ncbi:MAG TPA: tetratricopeptide repeat protein [Allosphingosinicella sp.]|jgi:tetratricopeptide (TPR) repeat protein
MRTWAVAAMMMAALGAAAAARAQDAPAEQRRIFEDLGNLTGATEDEGGTWLSLWEPHVRFRIEREPAVKRAELAFLIKRASEGFRAVSIRYDGRLGRLNRTTGTLDYPLCAIVLDDLRFEPTRRCDGTVRAAPDGPEGALALGRAYLGAGDFRRTQGLLARSDLPTDPGFRKIFLKVRAAAADAIGQSALPGSLDSDRPIAAALADYRALALLEPDDVEHQFAIARALQDLGGYAEANAVYDLLINRWPDEDFRIAVRRGGLYRGQGEHEKALDALNQLVARNGPQEGMKFYYHRAWTLSLLGRYDEAIADLSEGLRSQPDYGSAYLRRACAFAAVGRLREAVDDLTEASRLYAALPEADSATKVRDDLAAMRAFRARLEAALAQGVGKPVGGGCDGSSWRPMERPRPRSPLLSAR